MGTPKEAQWPLAGSVVLGLVQFVAFIDDGSHPLITAAVHRGRLGRAIGIQGAAQAIGLSVGPSVGGFLIDSLGWRWVFFIAVPFGILGTVLGWIILPCTTRAAVRAAHRHQERFDWKGALLVGPSVALLLFALTFANAWGWSSFAFLSVTALAAAGLAIFLAIERRAIAPLMDLSLFCSRLFTVGIVAGLLSYSVLFGSLFLLPFYLERILHQTPAATGLLLSPIPLALGIMAPLAGSLTDRFGSRLPTVAGMVVSGATLTALAVVANPGLPATLVLLGGLGVGLGLFTPPNNSAIMGSAPRHRLGVAGGILNMTRSIGTSLGVALTGAILALLLSTHSGEHVAGTVSVNAVALQAAFHQTLYFLAGLSVVAAVLSGLRGTAAPAAVPPQHSMAESVGV